MRNVLLALLLAGCPCLLAQEAPAEKRKDLATLQGRAVNSANGEPFRDESITLRALPPGADAWVVVSDSEGRFLFEDLKPGSYILCVRRFGDDGMPVTLSASQALKDVEFKITPPGIIRGTVVDDEGKPMAGVIVSARGGIAKLSGVAFTNSGGEFRFPNLAPGSYVLLAVPIESRLKPAAPTPAGRPDRAEERFLPTYYPAADDAAGAVPLEVVAGQDLQGITIVVRKGRVYHVQGTVVPSSPDTPLADIVLAMRPRTQSSAIVIVSPSGDGRPSARAPRRDGSFELVNVQRGSYYLTASRQGLPKVTLGRVQVDVSNADVAGIVLRIGEPLQIQGKMRMEGQDKPDFASVRVQLRQLDYLGGNLPGVALDAENTFTLKDVPPDKLQVVVTGLPERAYLKSARVGGQETIESGLDLTGMQSVAPLDILISPNGASVEGSVKQSDDKPAPGAWVCLVPEGVRPELRSRIKSTTAGGDGRFSLAGVPPGEYRLYAFEPLQREPYGNWELEFLKAFESEAMKLSLEEGERKPADVKALKLKGTGLL